MSLNGLDDKQILTFMQLTSGKTYTFVGTSGDYSDYMCVTAGMFADATVNITKWCIVVTELTINSGDIYIALNDNLDDYAYAYLAPLGIAADIDEVQNFQEEYMSMPGPTFMFTLNNDSNNTYMWGPDINLGWPVEDEPFRFGSLSGTTYYLNGGTKFVYQAGPISYNGFDCSNISMQNSSSAASFTIEADLTIYNNIQREHQQPQIIYGHNEDSLEGNPINLIWSLRFSNFASNAQLYSGQKAYGNISTTETSREQIGNTMYRYVKVTTPSIWFVQS